MNPMQVKIDDLPDLGFEKILSYLSLEDRIKSRAVSPRWCKMIDSFKVKSLCFSELQKDCILGKARLVRGAFAQNFIRSPIFDQFFNAFGQSIFSSLKHLLLCDCRVNVENDEALLARTLRSFGQLEELSIIRFDYQCAGRYPNVEFELNLPMLNCTRLEEVHGIAKLTLDAPRLRTVELKECNLRMVLVHGESVERLITGSMRFLDVTKLKNLKYLHCQNNPLESGYLRNWSDRMFDSTFLSDLKQLKEVHLDPAEFQGFGELCEQKQRYGRVDPKIFYGGLLLNSLADQPDMFGLKYMGGQCFDIFAANQGSKLAEITYFSPWMVCYESIERVADPELAITVLNRFFDLTRIIVSEPVQDIERFLNLLKSSDSITELHFKCDQPQDLFDRLPEHCCVQALIFHNSPPPDCLLRLQSVNFLSVLCSIDTAFIRQVLERLQFLTTFKFQHLSENVEIEIGHHPKHFQVSIGQVDEKSPTDFVDLNAALQFIVENTQANTEAIGASIDLD